MDLQYSDVRLDKGLYNRLVARGSMQRLVTEQQVLDAVDNPPTDTRAYFRGECLRRFGADIAAASWDSVIFDLGGDSLVRIPTLEPLRGSKAHVGALARLRRQRGRAGRTAHQLTCPPPGKRTLPGRLKEPSTQEAAMAQEQTKRGGGGGDDDDPTASTAAGQERREKLTEDTDDLLDEIDDVLEENAEDFVRAYVQKGGQ